MGEFIEDTHPRVLPLPRLLAFSGNGILSDNLSFVWKAQGESEFECASRVRYTARSMNASTHTSTHASDQRAHAHTMTTRKHTHPYLSQRDAAAAKVDGGGVQAAHSGRR